MRPAHPAVHEFVIKERRAKRLRRDGWDWSDEDRERGDDDKYVDRSGEHIFPPVLLFYHSFHFKREFAGNAVSVSLSLRVVENDAERVAVSRPDAADAVPEIDPIHAASALNRSMMNREHDAVTLAQRHNDRPRLHSWPLLRHHEFAAGKVFVGFGQ